LTLSVLLGFILSAPLYSQEGTENLEAKKKMTTTVGLKDPKKAKETAPDTFRAKFTTSQGDFTVEVTRSWAPNGADRFYNLIKVGYYDDVAFFRVISGFMAQFGIHGDPEVNKVWRSAKIQDDPVKQSNTRGMVTFATSGPNSRTTQLFINFGDSKFLDSQGFSPFAKVVEGMDVVDKLHSGYGEGAPRGQGPDQPKIQSEGNTYLKSDFPKLDWIKKARLVEAGS
jgi:peptidyl-prolyl cis-trans isomerase A (cyclophilin A)